MGNHSLIKPFEENELNIALSTMTLLYKNRNDQLSHWSFALKDLLYIIAQKSFASHIPTSAHSHTFFLTLFFFAKINCVYLIFRQPFIHFSQSHLLKVYIFSKKSVSIFLLECKSFKTLRSWKQLFHVYTDMQNNFALISCKLSFDT